MIPAHNVAAEHASAVEVTIADAEGSVLAIRRVDERA
jgi:uncharacterized protein GlcG (DUF336 family)